MELASRKSMANVCTPEALNYLLKRQAPFSSFHISATHYLETFGAVIQVKRKKKKNENSVRVMSSNLVD